MKKVKQKPIAQHLQEWLDADQTLTDGRSRIEGSDINKIIAVVNGKLDNFIIFNNAGGRTFHIWAMHEMKHKGIGNFRKLVSSLKHYAFMYKVNGKETIVQELPIYKKETVQGQYPELYSKNSKQ